MFSGFKGINICTDSGDDGKGSKGGKFADFRNSGSANRTGEDVGNNDVFMYIKPAAFFKKVFHRV